MFANKTIEELTQSTKDAIIEMVGTDWDTSDVLDYEINNYINQEIFSPAFDDRDHYENDEERLSEIELSLKWALDDLAEELRHNEDVPHERADGDSNVIYEWKTVNFYTLHTDEVDEEIEMYGGLEDFGSISEAMRFGVYMVIRRGYEHELQEMADIIEDIDAMEVLRKIRLVNSNVKLLAPSEAQ